MKVFALLLLPIMTVASAQNELDRYDLDWVTTGSDSAGSMPIGNGEVGANVWIEPNGDIMILVSRTDSFSEACRLLKLGRVRIKVNPDATNKVTRFRQKLRLRDGRMEFQIGGARVELFVDSDEPSIWVTGNTNSVTYEIESWRNEERELKGGDLDASWTMKGSPKPVRESRDWPVPISIDYNVETDKPKSIKCLIHENKWSVIPETLALQALTPYADLLVDPILGKAFGLMCTRHRRKGNQFAIQIVASHEKITGDHFRPPSLAIFDISRLSEARKRTALWWRAFWDRSFIFVEGDKGLAIPSNRMPLRLGFDSAGGNRFAGEIRGATAISRVLTNKEVADLAKNIPQQTDTVGPIPKPNLAQGFTCSAWIKPEAPVGRIFDNLTAGQDDGFLFDTHPGYSLRAIVGSTTVTTGKVLQEGKWSHVALTVDPRSASVRIYLNGKIVAENQPDNVPSIVTQKYILQRWVTACGGRGRYPIKFNGSIFTVEPKPLGQPFDPDWRRWGDCYWWQNTRIPYAPLLASGDYEMLDPLFRMYVDAIPLARARSKAYHGVEGAYFPETMTIFGTYGNNDYGWDRTGLQPKDVQCPWWMYAWNQGPELLMLMLDRYAHKPDAEFREKTLAPMVSAVLDYFDSRFTSRDANGKMRITPTQAAETYWFDVTNDTPTVAGLHAILPRLIALGDFQGWPTTRLRGLLDILPPVPVAKGKIAPAESYKDQRNNVENPEFYAIWPFKLYGVGQPDLPVAQKTFRERIERANAGWQYDGQVAALCGLTEEAKRSLLYKCANSNPAYRWPASWGPNYDWLPDQCHGGNLMLTLQTMLLQEANGKLYVLPAWPKEWSVKFKLRASQGTVVEVDYRAGSAPTVTVTPTARAKDVVSPSFAG